MSAGRALFDTAIGRCGIAWQGGALVGVQLPEPHEARTLARLGHAGLPLATPPAWVAAAIARIQRLLAGTPDDLLDLPLAVDRVPEFDQAVYAAARRIPVGQVVTYGTLAARIGSPGAARAVGASLGRNPFAPVVPCHRILAAAGAAGGFSAAGGTRTKLRLLEIERAVLGPQPGLFDTPHSPG